MEKTLEVHEKSQVGEVRRLVAEMAAAQGLSEADQGRAALVATEASTNLVKYGKHGVINLSLQAERGLRGVQIVAMDKGPGFANFQASARDGHSTGGSLGIGLGVIMRASDVFDVYTQPAQGSAFLSRILPRTAGAPPPPPVLAGTLSVGVRTTPKAGETECGDAWVFTQAGRVQRLCVVDGLGHGPLAARAAAEAVETVRDAADGDTPAAILARAHERLQPTRGAVMAVVAIDAMAGSLSFCGIGNIAGAVYAGDDAQHLLSVEGVVGYNARAFRTQELRWTGGSVVILSSDGLSNRRSLARYPGLLQHHASLVASVMHRDFARDADDATVLVAKGTR
ncbi:SpoIIE family protein phosphatase [uncultured Ramlibacter sp.]|uniref:SpoIIE family protein phosphatase n=1 Tax=uncultured Ramlibacter sp. TaxID=260755 RepID=UPI002628B67E|nr:SpoIIE family protein phosphatase [uncultured Ramlibacter sp.]